MKRIIMSIAAISIVMAFTNCSGKKEPQAEETIKTEEVKEITTVNDTTSAKQETEKPPLPASFIGSWNEPDGDQHNLTLKDDKTFEYQDFEKTKSGDLIDVMRQGTYTIEGDVVHLKGDDGWQMTLRYDADNGEAHLKKDANLDFVKE